MTEPSDKKRGWWSRFVGADGSRPSPEELIQQLAQELTETREFADRLAVERDAALATHAKRAREDAAVLARARAEIEQVRRAADAQLASVRAQLDEARKEYGEERAHREQAQREAHARQREVAAARAAVQRAEEDLARARNALSATQLQLDDSRRAVTDARNEHAAYRRLAVAALHLAVGEQGSDLAIALAARPRERA